MASWVFRFFALTMIVALVASMGPASHVLSERSWAGSAAATAGEPGSPLQSGAATPPETFSGAPAPPSALPELVPGDPSIYGRSPPQSSEAALGANSARRASGAVRALVLLIEFQDFIHSAGSEPSDFSRALFNSSPGARSLRAYFMENSYGRLDVGGEVVPVWLKSEHNMSQYGADALPGVDNANGPIHRLVTEAVRKADPVVDFSGFDMNGDGYIDFLMIVHAGQGQESSYLDRNTIWSHRWYDYDEPVVDGVVAGFYMMCSEFSPIGTFAHEFGHELGLPDLYDTDGDSLGAGYWDLMALGSWLDGGSSPAHLSAYCKMRLGWLAPVPQTTDAENLSLQAVELAPAALRLWIEPPHEYFLIENRQALGWDACIPGPGLLIWHIDERAADNRDRSHRLVDLEEADEALNGDSPVQHTDPWRDCEEGFTPSSTPPSSACSGRPTGWWVHRIGPSASTMSFSVRNVEYDAAVTSLDYELFASRGVGYQVSATVHNLGGRYLGAVHIEFSIFGKSASIAQSETIEGLETGQWRDLEWSWTPLEEGVYFIAVIASAPGDAIPENDLKSGVARVIEPIFFDDVEAGAGAWRAGTSPPILPSLWHIVDSSGSTGGAHSESHSWWCGFERTGKYTRSAGFVEFYLESPVIDLTRVGSAGLAVWMRHDLSHDLPYELTSDYGCVEASSSPGGSWTTLGEVRGSAQDWCVHSYDLTDFAGGRVKLRFVLHSNALLLGRGWWLDDITVFASGAIYDVAVGALPNWTSALPGEVARLNVTVANAGSRPDTFDIIVDAPEGVIASLAPSSAQLSVFGESTVALALKVVGRFEAGAALVLTVRAVSRAAPRVSASVSIGVEVLRESGAELQCERPRVAFPPGGSAGLRVNLTNTGNGREWFELSVTGERAALAALPRTGLSVGAWSTEELELFVSVPPNATAGEVLRVALVASSDGGALASLVLEVEVSRVYGAVLGAEKMRAELSPGGLARFTVFLRNTGNGRESFMLKSTCPAGWMALHDVVVPLGPWAETALTLDVEVGRESPGGPHSVFLEVVGEGGEGDELELVVLVQLPDVELSGLKVEPGLLDEGEMMGVRFTVRNSGAAEARDVMVRLYDNGKKIREWYLESLGPGESQALSTGLRLGAGNHQLSAQASMVDRELSLSNNEAHGEARVRAAGLAPGPGFLLAALAAGAALTIARRGRGPRTDKYL
ncbi:MAG: M6 family metalloprotease domain-containing protein [Thermoplasmatota archaeon]